MPSRPTVVVGFLGSTLDAASHRSRHDRWRPTVDLCSQDDLLVHRLDLLHDPKHAEFAAVVAGDCRLASPDTEVVLHPFPLANPWDFEEVYGALHDFATTHPVDPEQEDLLVHITTGSHVAQICLFLLTEARYFPGRLLQTSPPRRNDRGPRGTAAVIDLDLSRYDRLAARFARERTEGVSILKSGIPTRNAAFNRMIERIERVAGATRAPILLLGPTGAGKSRLARRVYELKRTRHGVVGPFVELNCATLRGDAAASALFGHVRGAFTGAVSARPGLLRAADGGVLFLDEIGELGLDEQAMLLRALEEKVFLPVGSDKEVRSDFQLLGGTNRDLTLAVREGRFREDLLARIDLWTFRLPALRELLEALEPNLDYELEQAARAAGGRVTLSAEARAAFLAFASSPEARWAANFRDLNAAVTRMATLAPGGRITVDGVREEIERLRRAWSAPATRTDAESLLAEVLSPEALAGLDRFDRVQLADVLAVCRESRSLSEAGRTLFAASLARRTSVNDADRLRKYLARFGVSFETARGPGAATEGPCD